jgi:hypothetical protein
MQYTESQLTQLIADVEKEFTAHLAKAEDAGEATLAKAEEEKEHTEEKEEHKEGEPKEDKPEGHQAETSEEAPKADAGHDYDDQDMSHLHQMYMSMSEGERKVHHDAIMKCGMMKCGEGSPTGDPSGSPGAKSADSHSHPDVQKAEHSDGLIKPSEPKGSPGAQSPASKDQKNLNDMEKKEATRESGGKMETTGEPKGSPGAKSPATKAQGNLTNMEKSENTETELLKSELANANGKYEELKKNFDAVAAFLTKLVEKKQAPAAKAITSLEAVTKSEGAEEDKTLTKSEIDSKLLQKAQSPSTSKADRDAINAFYLSGEGIKSISHLLK